MSSTRGTAPDYLALAAEFCRPASVGFDIKSSNLFAADSAPAAPAESPPGQDDVDKGRNVESGPTDPAAPPAEDGGGSGDAQAVAAVAQAVEGVVNAVVVAVMHEDRPEVAYKRARDKWAKALQGLHRTRAEYRAVEEKIAEAAEAKRPGWRHANDLRRDKLERIQSKARGILDINSPGLANTGNIDGWRRLTQKYGDVLFGLDANRDLFNIAYALGIGQPLEPMPSEIFDRRNLRAMFPGASERSHREGFPPLHVRQRALSQMVNMATSGMLPGEIRPPLWIYGLNREDRADAGIGPTIAQVVAALDSGESVVLAGPPVMDYRIAGRCAIGGSVGEVRVSPMPADPETETIGEFQKRIAGEIIRASQAADPPDQWLLGKAQRVFAAPAWRGDDRSNAKKYELLTNLTIEGSDVYVDPERHPELGSIIQGEFARLELNPPDNWSRALQRGIQRAGEAIEDAGRKVKKAAEDTASKWPYALAIGGVAGGVYLAGPEKLLRWFRGK